MKLQISASDLPLSGTVENVVVKHLRDDLAKYLKKYDDLVADVLVKKRSRWGYKVKFDMMLPGNHHVFCEEVHDDFVAAVCACRDEVKRQLLRIKEKNK